MTKPPILLLPGLLNDGRLWDAQIGPLSSSTPVHVGDLTAHDSIADIATSVIAQAPPGRFALVGFSMGGYVALEVMRQAPERIAGLALIDTSARPDTAQARKTRELAIQQSQTDFAGVVEKFPARVLHPRRHDDAALVDVIRAMSLAVGQAAFARQQRAVMSRIDSRPHLAAIRCRTLVACGREDLLTPLGVHEEIAEQIAGAQLAVIERCGHMSPIEQPGAVTELLDTWWRLVASEARA